MDRNTLLDLIPAYALGALDPDEHAAVEAWLATDAEARRLLAEFQSLADWLILATPARPAPAYLGDDLRRRLTADRSQTRPTLAVDMTHGKPTPAARPRLPLRRLTWLPVAFGIAAALVIVAVVVLLLARPTDPGLELYNQIMAQADIRRIPITPAQPDTTRGELVMTADGQKAVIEVFELPQINPDQTFQLWLIDDQGARSGGIFRFDQPEGPHYIPVPLDKPVGTYTAFGVSIEPQGGSPKPDGPTGPRIFAVTVSI